MGLFSKRDKDEQPKAPQGRALVASAMPLSGPEGKQAWQASSGDASWQTQAWYYYDTIGELRFAFNWLANAISRASLYAAETDPETGRTTGPTDDMRAQAAAQAVLGGADDRPQLQSTMALQWQVSGETYVVILSQPAGQDGKPVPDRWLCLSRRAMRERAGAWSYKDPLTGVWAKLDESTSKVMRVWSPHPDEQTHADSAMRACLPILNEVEKTSQNIVARLDSRLASNGLYLIPQEVDFSSAESEQSSSESFRQMLMDAMTASMTNPGTALAQAPIVADVPGEWLEAMANAHVDFATAMDAAITELRKDAVQRVGATLDMPREMAMGELAQANHWSGWLIEESTYKIHVEPFLLKFGMALTKTWYRPALAAMGEPNPGRFVLAWDITEVVARPDDKEDTKYLLENNLVSRDWVRGKFGVPDDAIPSEEEARLNLATVLATQAPTVLENESIARVLGFEPTVQPTAVIGAAPDAEQPTGPRALPGTRSSEPDAALVAAAELVALDALGRAGGRLLTPAYRGQFKDVDRWALHTVIPLPTGPARDQLLDGSFQHVPLLARGFDVDTSVLRTVITAYVLDRITSRTAHDRTELREFLRDAL